MSDRGSLNMRNITRAVQEVIDWYSVGVALNIHRYKLDEIKQNHQFSNSTKQCKFSLIDVWLRTDLTASWGKLALALEEAGYTIASGRIKEEYLGILATDPIPPSALIPPKIGSSLGALGTTAPYQAPHLQPMMAQPPPPQPFPAYRPPQIDGGMANHHRGVANHHGGGFIASDGVNRVQSHAPVPILAQAPITSVTEAMQLLKTSQERLISGLTHSKLDVNFSAGGPPGMTLLHYAAMQGANTDCLKALIAFGADVNPLNEHGLTPLDLAIMSSPAGGEMVTLLEGVGGVKGRNLTHGCQPATEQNSHRVDHACNILSLSSSGPYSLVQLQVLQLIEAQSRRKITHLFHWIVASGFGALFLLLIIYGNKAVSEVKRLYFKLREEVFCQPDMARRSQALDGFLQAHLGTQMMMTDIQQPRLMVGALYKGSTKVETRLFNNCLHDNYSDIPVWKVARYTCSLPLNIMESDSYTSTDPSLPNLSSLGLRRVRQFYSDSGKDPGEMVRSLVCVEGGQCDAHELGCVDIPAASLSVPDSAHSTWFSSQGALQRLTHLLTLHHSSSLASGEESLSCCRELCELYDVRFHHFSPLLSRRATLSVDVPLKDLVDSVMETISQVVGKPLYNLLTDINNY